MSYAQSRGEPFSQTATGSTSAVATQTGQTNKTSYVTDVSASSDKAGSIILVKKGTTVIWQDIVGATYYSRSFSTPLNGGSGADVSVTIDGTSASKANIAGVIINNT